MTNILMLSRAGTFISFWGLLELNLIFFVGLLTLNSKSIAPQAAVKYLVIQGIASTILLAGAIRNIIFGFNSTRQFLIPLSALIKLGVAPFQRWFIRIRNSISWPSFFLLATFQKIPPMLLFLWAPFYPALAWILILRRLTVILGTMRKLSIRAVLVYSSVLNSSWILILVKAQNIFWFVFCIYTWGVGLRSVEQFTGDAEISKGSTILGLFFLRGIPPFIGAIHKFILMEVFIHFYGIRLAVVFIIISGWILYLYLSLVLEAINLWVVSRHKVFILLSSKRILNVTSLFLPLVLILL